MIGITLTWLLNINYGNGEVLKMYKYSELGLGLMGLDGGRTLDYCLTFDD